MDNITLELGENDTILFLNDQVTAEQRRVIEKHISHASVYLEWAYIREFVHNLYGERALSVKIGSEEEQDGGGENYRYFTGINVFSTVEAQPQDEIFPDFTLPIWHKDSNLEDEALGLSFLARALAEKWTNLQWGELVDFADYGTQIIRGVNDKKIHHMPEYITWAFFSRNLPKDQWHIPQIYEHEGDVTFCRRKFLDESIFTNGSKWVFDLPLERIYWDLTKSPAENQIIAIIVHTPPELKQ